MKKPEFKKMRRGLGTSRTSLNIPHLNYRGTRRRGRLIENLFEKIIKANFPNLAKEIDFQEVQEAHRVPENLDPRNHTPRHIIVTLPKLKIRKEPWVVFFSGLSTSL